MKEAIPEEDFKNYEKLLSRQNLIDTYHKGETEFDFVHRYSANEFENMPEITTEQYEKSRVAAAAIFGEEQGKNYLEYTDMKVIRKFLDDTGKYYFTMKYESKGHLCYKRYAYNYLTDEKNIILSTVQDITSIQQKDETQLKAIQEALADAERANLAKSAFLSNMSHDIRTPMNAIINMTKMALEDLPDSEKTASDLKK